MKKHITNTRKVDRNCYNQLKWYLIHRRYAPLHGKMVLYVRNCLVAIVTCLASALFHLAPGKWVNGGPSTPPPPSLFLLPKSDKSNAPGVSHRPSPTSSPWSSSCSPRNSRLSPPNPEMQLVTDPTAGCEAGDIIYIRYK